MEELHKTEKKVIVQVSFSKTEYEHLFNKADTDGISIAHYIRGKVLGDTDFKIKFIELLARVSRIKPGTLFNIKMVFATDWPNIDKGVRLALGRTFYNYVNTKKISGVEIVPEKDSAHVQWYVKGDE